MGAGVPMTLWSGGRVGVDRTWKPETVVCRSLERQRLAQLRTVPQKRGQPPTQHNFNVIWCCT